MSLAVTYEDLRRELGRFLGWGRNPDNWTDDQTIDAQDIIKSALRRIYWPVDSLGGKLDYQWSFLVRIGELALSANQETYQLPEEFGDIVGRFYYATQVGYPPIAVVPLRTVLESKSRVIAQAVPRMAALVPSYDDGTKKQVWQAIFAPTPDGHYRLRYAYNLSMDAALDSTKPYPPGGNQYGELFIEAVLAVAEIKLMDQPGIHWENFRLELASAIERDARSNTAETLGYNLDRTEQSAVPDVTLSAALNRAYLKPVSYGGLQ